MFFPMVMDSFLITGLKLLLEGSTFTFTSVLITFSTSENNFIMSLTYELLIISNNRYDLFLIFELFINY